MAISLLLADDSPTIAKILKMALANEDYDIRSVLTADNAIVELRENPPMIFLVDLTLPEKDGYTLAALVKNDLKLKHVRVALLASAFDPVDPLKLKECGADSVLVKPFEPKELRKKLSELQSPNTKLPEGASVRGSMMGVDVSLEGNKTAKEPSLLIEMPPPAPRDESTISSLSGFALDSRNHTEASDVDSILLSLLEKSEASAVFDIPPPPPTQAPQPTQATVAEEPVVANPVAHEEPAELSDRAQALASFFAAEVESHEPAIPEEAPITLDLNEEVALPTPDFESLASWSSNSTQIQDPKPAALKAAISTKSPKLNSGFEFDTGGSNFRFSEDYTQRITRAFTGDLDEQIPERGSVTPQSLFSHQSSDSPAPKAAPAAVSYTSAPEPVTPITQAIPNFGNLNAEETAKIEQMIREEVHLVCREIVEKVAWELIPELAENLIKKELQKVLKELES